MKVRLGAQDSSKSPEGVRKFVAIGPDNKALAGIGTFPDFCNEVAVTARAAVGSNLTIEQLGAIVAAACALSASFDTGNDAPSTIEV